MEILNLTLFNFRNFAKRNFTFDPKLTVIIGPNGAGKSNILEAVSLLSARRSSRVETDVDLVKFAETEAKIQGDVFGLEKNTLTINFQIVDEIYLKKTYFINAFRKRLLDFSDLVSIIIFEPFDLDLVSGSPSLRRHHLDEFLASCDREYRKNINAYHKIVVRRNRILARIGEGKAKVAELSFWDERLVEHGQYISQKRQDFFEWTADYSKPGLKGIYKPGLSGEAIGGFSWTLKQSLLTEEKLFKNRDRDIAAGMTLSGPHRDDFRFVLQRHDLEFFGSRGEQRMAVLALKLAELEYLTGKRGQRPILALDDIFSELDWEHRQMVFAVVGKQQTIITAAEADSVPKQLLKKAKIIKLGQV